MELVSTVRVCVTRGLHGAHLRQLEETWAALRPRPPGFTPTTGSSRTRTRAPRASPARTASRPRLRGAPACAWGPAAGSRRFSAVRRRSVSVSPQGFNIFKKRFYLIYLSLVTVGLGSFVSSSTHGRPRADTEPGVPPRVPELGEQRRSGRLRVHEPERDEAQQPDPGPTRFHRGRGDRLDRQTPTRPDPAALFI